MKQKERTDMEQRRLCAVLGGIALMCGLLALWKAFFCFPGVVLGAVCLGKLSRLPKPGPGERGLDRCARALAAAGLLCSLVVVMAFTVHLTRRTKVSPF